MCVESSSHKTEGREAKAFRDFGPDQHVYVRREFSVSCSRHRTEGSLIDPPSLGDGGHLPEGDVHADGVAVVHDVDSLVVEGNHHLGQRHARTHHLAEK